MRLAETCVRCGAGARDGGRRFHTKRYAYPWWIWLGLPFAVIPAFVLCLVGKKTLDISFSLCPVCNHRRLLWYSSAWTVWLLLTATLLLSVWLENAWILPGSAVLLGAAVTLSVLSAEPLRVCGYESGDFTVKGFGEGFGEGFAEGAPRARSAATPSG